MISWPGLGSLCPAITARHQAVVQIMLLKQVHAHSPNPAHQHYLHTNKQTNKTLKPLATPNSGASLDYFIFTLQPLKGLTLKSLEGKLGLRHTHQFTAETSSTQNPPAPSPHLALLLISP